MTSQPTRSELASTGENSGSVVGTDIIEDAKLGPEPQGVAISPLMVDAADAARLCSVSRALWRKLARSGRCPVPVRLGRRCLWSVAELGQWVAAGCPPRSKWQAGSYRQHAAATLAKLPKTSRPTKQQTATRAGV